MEREKSSVGEILANRISFELTRFSFLEFFPRSKILISRYTLEFESFVSENLSHVRDVFRMFSCFSRLLKIEIKTVYISIL